MIDKLKEYISTSEGKLCGVVFRKPEILLDYTINRKLLSDSALFYIGIVERLMKRNIEVVDEISFTTEVENIGGGLVKFYEDRGGYATVSKMAKVVHEDNTDAIIDEWHKYHLAQEYYNKGILNLSVHWNKIQEMSSNQLVDYLEHQLTDVDINVSSDIVFEKLSYTDEEISALQQGINIGLNYGKHSPLLNYLTSGVAKSNVYLFGGYTNSGKSSYIFENMICSIIEGGHKCCVISNEQKSAAFKVLLQIHVLTERLNYWKLTRKKINNGDFTDEDIIMMKKARDIIKEEYDPYLTFVKLFDYNTNQVSKIVKKLSKTGYECFFYDTFKVSESGDGATWEKLLADSKDLFQIASKNDIALIMSVQLALHSKNKTRWLDEGVLSNGKQMAETVETGVYMRDIWSDEWDGETYDIKPYKFLKDSNGKYTNDKEYIILDRNKKYKLMFLSKCRSDENGQVLIYEFNGLYNKWYEIARCTPHTKNLY